MTTQEPISIFSNHIEKIHNQPQWTVYQKNKAYFELFTLIIEEATKEEKLNFTTLFSRLAYVGAKYKIRSSSLHYSHIFRKGHEQNKINSENEILYIQLAEFICSQLLIEIWNLKHKNKLTLPIEAKSYFHQDKKKNIGFRSVVEAVLFEIDVEKKQLLFYDEEDASVEKIALYDIHDKNEQFNQNIDSLIKSFVLPIHINLIDVDIREDGMYLPTAFIVQPDHLIDVTAVAECFKDYGAEPFLYLISKFKPTESTTPLLIGNLVNFILDELISDPKISFQSLLPKMFHTNPLGFAMIDDTDLKDIINKLSNHYTNLSMVVNQEFGKYNIQRENIFLEPSFYSRDYGIQGRLDLLHQRIEDASYDIIELKSGSTFKPNVYGINASHYVQTLLYELMIKSTFYTKARSFNYILYSKEGDKPLRFAPPVKAQQYEAMKLRNDLLAIDQKLKMASEDGSILSYIKPENFPKLKGFNANDITNFYNIYTTLKKLEKVYFDHFTAFIANEQSQSKTGEHGIHKSNGHAALWLENEEEKKDRFAILTGLSLIQNLSSTDDAFITLQRNEADNTLVNFRVGDIGVLYPSSADTQRAVLKNQIFKCSITELFEDKVTIKLRNKQYNQSLFKDVKSWNIELDSLDSGFMTMYKNLFSFAAAPIEYRQLILGQRKPQFIQNKEEVSFGKEVTESQNELLNKIIRAKDYFLLWGPPGTGKTSVMLKHLVKHLHTNSKENILLLAYTNRAVDEICDAVLSIGDTYQNLYLRLGSRTGAGEKYSGNLLDQAVKKTSSRQEIIEMLTECRIYISTVSSIVNRTDLFHLKDFDTVIIDEASQILEPMLVGLLSRFKRFILIGDHKQLPAVVVQDGYKTKINDELLLNAGFSDTRISLFERLFMQSDIQSDSEAIGILNQQGRMHQEIMEFPSHHFYSNKLALLPGIERLKAEYFFDSSTDENHFLRENRKLFIDTPEDEDINWKTNVHEAQTVLKLLQNYIELYKLNKMELTADSIGVITPYRAQIAMIRKEMEVLSPEINAKISVDTVERYQGGARDIILISFCVNKVSQLENLVSPSMEGIDRKLNVALTRSRESIVLIGNKSILSENETYRKIIDTYKKIKL